MKRLATAVATAVLTAGVLLIGPPVGATLATSFTAPPLENVAAVSCGAQGFCEALGGDEEGRVSIVGTTDYGAVWQTQQAPSGIESIYDVWCDETGVCYATGQGGVIMTSNYGVDWTLVNATAQLEDISCIDDESCFAVAGNAVWSTTDSGTSWTQTNMPGPEVDLSAISCEGATCVAAGYSADIQEGVIDGTTNGGTSWSVEYAPDYVNASFLWTVTSASCSNNADCVVGGDNESGQPTTMATTSGGTTWTQTSSIPAGGSLEALSCVLAAETSYCIAVGTNHDSTPYAISSTDNGTSWQSVISLPADDDWLTGLSCNPTTTSVACTAVGNVGANDNDGSTVTATTDFGTTWQDQALPSGINDFAGVSCPTTSECLAVGTDSIATTTNGGTSWSTASPPVGVDELQTVTCPSSSVCLAGGLGGFSTPVEINTTNGGGTWTMGSVPSGQGDVRSIACASVTVCFAVGQSLGGYPTIMGTSNGGSSWTAEAVPVGVDGLSAISCKGVNKCWAVGTIFDEGEGGSVPTILATTDGGSAWTDQFAPTGITGLVGLSCVPATTTCIADGSGIIQTTDGTTWSTVLAPGEPSFDTAYCVTTVHCYVAGGNTLLGTPDGGTTWNTKQPPSNVQDLLRVTCSSSACQGVGIGTNDGAFILPF